MDLQRREIVVGKIGFRGFTSILDALMDPHCLRKIQEIMFSIPLFREY